MSDTHRKSHEGFTASLRWALGFVWQSSRSLTLANVTVTVIQSVLPLAALYLTKLVIDSVTTALTASDRSAAFRNITGLIVLSAAVVVADRALGIIADLIRTAQTYIATDRVYEILHAKSVEVDLEYYENSEYYDALYRAQQEAPYRPSRILDSVFGFAQSAISVVALGGSRGNSERTVGPSEEAFNGRLASPDRSDHSRLCFVRLSRIPSRGRLDDGGRSCDVLPSRPARPILPRPTAEQRRRAVREQSVSLKHPRIPKSQTQSHRSAKAKEAGSNQRGRRSGLSRCEIPIPEL